MKVEWLPPERLLIDWSLIKGMLSLRFIWKWLRFPFTYHSELNLIKKSVETRKSLSAWLWTNNCCAGRNLRDLWMFRQPREMHGTPLQHVPRLKSSGERWEYKKNRFANRSFPQICRIKGFSGSFGKWCDKYSITGWSNQPDKFSHHPRKYSKIIFSSIWGNGKISTAKPLTCPRPLVICLERAEKCPRIGQKKRNPNAHFWWG